VKILVTNDDGIFAPGLAALEAAASEFGEIITVAPNQCFSSCGHVVTAHRGLEVTEVSAGRFMVDGSPADCVRVGLLHLVDDVAWVLSGINSGGNLGADIYMSGTVAAAREAMLLGKRAIAFSQYRKTRDFDAWPKATRMAVATMTELLKKPPESHTLWNVNLPDEPGDAMPARVYCPADLHPLPVAYEAVEGKLHYRSNYHSRARSPGHDVDVCFGGRISISLLRHAF
jgi:5'-nucleotidase